MGTFNKGPLLAGECLQDSTKQSSYSDINTILSYQQTFSRLRHGKTLLQTEKQKNNFLFVKENLFPMMENANTAEYPQS